MYTLDSVGRIGLAEPIIARGDAQALATARRLGAHAKRCELWKDNRLVASLDERELGGRLGGARGEATAADENLHNTG
jgi:hypothetical protein